MVHDALSAILSDMEVLEAKRRRSTMPIVAGNPRTCGAWHIHSRTCQMNSTSATDRVVHAACNTVTCTSAPLPELLPSRRSVGHCKLPPAASDDDARAAASFTSACARLRGGPLNSHTLAPDAVATCSFFMSACTCTTQTCCTWVWHRASQSTRCHNAWVCQLVGS